jgi:hypothetical protein
MSALGQKQTDAVQNGMSALPPIADICSATRHVRLVPIADIREMTLTKRPPRGGLSEIRSVIRRPVAGVVIR